MRAFVIMLFIMCFWIPPAAFAKAGYDDAGIPIPSGDTQNGR